MPPDTAIEEEWEEEGEFPLLTDYVYYFSEGMVPGDAGKNALTPKERSKVVMASKILSKAIAPEKRTIFTEMRILSEPHDFSGGQGIFEWAARLDCGNLDPGLKRREMRRLAFFGQTLSREAPRFIWSSLWGNRANQTLFFINGSTYRNRDGLSQDALVLADSPVLDAKGRVPSVFLKSWLEELDKPITVTPEGWNYSNPEDLKRWLEEIGKRQR